MSRRTTTGPGGGFQEGQHQTVDGLLLAVVSHEPSGVVVGQQPGQILVQVGEVHQMGADGAEVDDSVGVQVAQVGLVPVGTPFDLPEGPSSRHLCRAPGLAVALR